jgi:hypothetical protein
MMGMLLRLPVVARSALRFRGDALAALTAERADEIKRSIVDGTANPGLLLGTDPSPWNNAKIVDGRQAQGALDLAAKASELWPSFERMLGQVVQQLGVRDPGSLDEVAALLSVLHDVHQLRARYAAELFGAQPAELARALAPATGGRAHRAWAFLAKKTYRASRKRLLALRAAPAPSATLRQEALEAEDILGWQMLFHQGTPTRHNAAPRPSSNRLGPSRRNRLRWPTWTPRRKPPSSTHAA